MVLLLATGCADPDTSTDGTGVDANGETPVAPGTMGSGGSSALPTPGTVPGSGMATAPECVDDLKCAGMAERPLCDVAAGVCVALPAGHLIGYGDGSASSVELTVIHRPSLPIETTDLGFHSERDELWLVNRRFEVSGQCTASNINTSERCRSLGSTTTIIVEPGGDKQSVVTREDQNSLHFMRRASGMAMGVNNAWATCGEAATGNFEDDPRTYMGPSLWSSDLNVFAQPSGANGSHLDMLHETPLCMGIAHERDNIYWLFNGEAGAIDRVDFKNDHGPGQENHDDGTVHRYVRGFLTRLAGVPSHLVFNPDDAFLYIVDSGKQRIVKLDTTSGKRVGPLLPILEVLAENGTMGDEITDVVVAPGSLVEPSGLALHEGVLYVSDHATSIIHAFDLAGKELRRLETDLPAGTLAGIAVGPDARLYAVDMLRGGVVRIDPQ